MEFKKASPSIEAQFVKLAGIACAAVAGLFSLWILLVLLTVREVNLAERGLGLAGRRINHLKLGDMDTGFFRPSAAVADQGGNRGSVLPSRAISVMMLFIRFIPQFLEQIPVGQMLVSFLWVWGGNGNPWRNGFGSRKSRSPIPPNGMFDIEYVIAEWRKQMLTARIKKRSGLVCRPQFFHRQMGP